MATFDVHYVPTSKIGMFAQLFLSPILAVTLDSMQNKLTRKSLLAEHRIKKGIALLKTGPISLFPNNARLVRFFKVFLKIITRLTCKNGADHSRNKSGAKALKSSW